MSATLANLTTLRLGGPARRIIEARTSEELVDVVHAADAAGEPMLLLGGGSNLVVADEGWPGTVVLVRTRGVVSAKERGGTVLVTLAAGEVWDEFVQRAIAEKWAGLESMSGIPGLVGATPIQNVGAYGSEVAETIVGLKVYDRRTGAVSNWSAAQCGFGFRTSAFKYTDRYIVLEVTFRLPRSKKSAPVRYLELARRLGVAQGDQVPSARVREAVLDLRRSKGMVLDTADHDTWSVGSFFVNPLVDAHEIPEGCPNWATDGRIKLSAAWLIENSGFTRGHGLPGRVAVSTKHTLALTNRGGATTAELLELAREIQAGVEAKFGIRLRPEAHLVGISLD